MGSGVISLPIRGRMADDSEEPPVCFNCCVKLEETLHVKCFECHVDICMLCFQCGAESLPAGSHRRGHNYELIKPESEADVGKWKHDDEFDLLKAAHKFKMGNWGEIAVSMGRPRTDGPKCKDYFEKHFVRGWIGQFSIKSANWDKIKYGMYINQTLESVLTKNSLESTERLLLIRDAIRDSGEQLDENDPKLVVKVQELLEKYVQKLVDGEIEVKYERPKSLPTQYEPELSADECDPDLEADFKTKLNLKQETASDNSDTPGPSCSYRSKAEPKAKKKKTTRVVRESSSESDDDTDTFQKSARSDTDNYHGLERETEDEDPNESAFETAHEFDSNDEEEEKKPRRGASSSATASTSRKRKRKRMWVSKKERRLHAFSVKMKREQKRGEKRLARNGTCSLDEVKELRSTYPRLLFESGTKIDKAKIRQTRHADDLVLLGYNVDREEFETEWFNDAEQLISRLTIAAAPAEKDQKLDIENDIKFARLQHYIRILGIRRAKRNTVLEHDKINEFYKFYKEMTCDRTLNATEVLESRSDKEKKLMMAQQFMTKDEHQAFRGVIERIDSLTDRIEVLQNLQRQGETTLRNAPPAERNKKKKLRKIDCEQRKKMASEWTRIKKWHTAGWEG